MRKLLFSAASLLLLVSLAACAAGGQNISQSVKVARGNLAISVSGSGTIELSSDINLTFGTSGRIDKLLVKEGDQVTEGQVIARLETDSMELALAQAELAYVQSQLTVKQYDVAVSQANVAVTQADINQKSAQIVLEQTVKTASVSDIRIAQADVDTAQRNLTDSLSTLSKYLEGTPGYEEYQKNVVLAQARLKAAQDRLDSILGGFSTDDVIVKQRQVDAANQALTAARQALDQAKLTADVGKQALDLAGKSRDYNKKQLDKAVIISPFAGIIAKVPVEEKDTVLATSTVARLINTASMELKIQVDEIDIPGVRLGQKAVVKVDALPGANISGTVRYISPLPTKEGGVTLFDVKIALPSDTPGLKGGMSANADVVITERTNVLLLPSRLIIQSAGKSVVNVSVDGDTTEKAVVTGITDGFQTEIVSGLVEGESVLDSKAK